jgi:hypothetical protein
MRKKPCGLAFPALVVVLLVAEPSLAFPAPTSSLDQAPISGIFWGRAASLRADFGLVQGLSFGLSLFFADYRAGTFGYEIALAARNLIGWDLDGSIILLARFGEVAGAWRPALGAWLEASLGSRLAGQTEKDPLVYSGSFGASSAFSGGLVLSPLEFSTKDGWLRVLRVQGGVEYGPRGLEPVAELEILGRLLRL